MEENSIPHKEKSEIPRSLSSDNQKYKQASYDNLNKLHGNKINIIFSNDKHKKLNNKIFKNNVISTTKYNVFTWIPKSLLLQFRRAANIYFLIISILTSFSFSPKNPITMSMTFGIVLVFTMLKEAYEVIKYIIKDIRRYYSDKEVNEKEVLIYNYNNAFFSISRSKEIKVGDIVRV